MSAPRRRRAALTLVEVLAAVAVLAVLAAAAVPLARRLAHGGTRLVEALDARAALERQLARPLAPGITPLADHAEWILRVEDLPPERAARAGDLPRTWRRVAVCAGMDAQARVLAEAVVVVAAVASPPAAEPQP